MGMIQDFKAFIARGNVLDMAVGVIIGGAFGKIVSSLTEDIIMPPIGILLGKVDFSSLYIPLINDPSKLAHPGDYAMKMTNLMNLPMSKVKDMGIPVIAYGSFFNQVMNFLIIAFCVFILIKCVARLLPPAPEAPPAPPATKVCPECLSEIPIKAKRCCHCTSVVPVEPEKDA